MTTGLEEQAACTDTVRVTPVSVCLPCIAVRWIPNPNLNLIVNNEGV